MFFYQLSGYPKGPNTIIVGILAPKAYAIPLLGPFGLSKAQTMGVGSGGAVLNATRETYVKAMPLGPC